jgi:hypothetical protein
MICCSFLQLLFLWLTARGGFCCLKLNLIVYYKNEPNIIVNHFNIFGGIMNYKKLTYRMRNELSKIKDLDLNKYGYSKNTPDIIELIDKQTGERLVINKHANPIRR